jgi:hypothetical protein
MVSELGSQTQNGKEREGCCHAPKANETPANPWDSWALVGGLHFTLELCAFTRLALPKEELHRVDHDCPA